MTSTPDYDTPHGIAGLLDSLEGLDQLIRARHQAGYLRGERMARWVVLGRYDLDAQGNTSLVLGADDTSAYDRVLSRPQFHLQHGDYTADLMPTIARPADRCIVCGTGWTIDNAHDCVAISNQSTADDPRPEPNRYHGPCRQSVVSARTRAELQLCFELAGYPWITMKPVENQRGTQSINGPWYEVTLPREAELGVILIGWRKRVILIDWSASGHDLSTVFADHQGTKGPLALHASTYAEAISVLRRLVSALREASTAEPHPV